MGWSRTEHRPVSKTLVHLIACTSFLTPKSTSGQNDACDILIEHNRIWTFRPQDLHQDLDRFAQDDGFADWQEMREWFTDTHGLPFQGVLIRWLVPPH
jgi:hypothetical protein